MIKVYQVFDESQGGPRQTPVAAFFNAADADRAAFGRGATGDGNGSVVPLDVYGSFDESCVRDLTPAPEELRERALQKLTPEEREALGVS